MLLDLLYFTTKQTASKHALSVHTSWTRGSDTFNDIEMPSVHIVYAEYATTYRNIGRLCIIY